MALECYRDPAFGEKVCVYYNDDDIVIVHIETMKEKCIFRVPTSEYEKMPDNEMPFIAGHFNRRTNPKHAWIPEIHMRGFEKYLVSRFKSSTW